MADFNYYNFTGGIDLVSAKINVGQSQKKCYWSDAQNVEIYKNSGITRMDGNTLLVDAGPEILGLFEYRIEDNKRLVVNAADGIFYLWNGSTLIPQKTGLSTTAKCSYVNYLDGVVVTNGVNDPFIFTEGTGVNQCSAPAVSNVVASYKGRLWLANGGTLYYSSLGKYNVWITDEDDDGGNITNFHNDYSDIKAIFPYKDYLAIHRQDQVYLLVGDDNTENFSIVPFADKGGDSPLGITNFENKQYFFDNGVFTLEPGKNGQIQISSEVSEIIKPIFNDIDRSRLNETFIVNYPEKKIYNFLFTI